MSSKLRPTYAFLKRLEFLSSGKLHLKDSVKAVTVTYNTHGVDSSGVRLSEVSGYFVSGAGDGRNVRLDVENKTPEQILSEFASVAGIPDHLARQAEREKTVVNSANFGNARLGRFCICEVAGQTPCPRHVPITNISHSWHNKDTSES
ncbi:Probable 28S ribosomal protein S25, mitochondrial [Geodia barretti]|uniref:Probable 28S ribosomal protein S25, mitochondrial n=1 Tax=Geodia barretti TaxID=519541 RepID=A0AA35QW05_GEOBA|nr:Probable 28S ribosomal protein S25, mitochondrial [Geodia barretti]